MRTTHASAPSKLMLSGEYAVLDGAPAVVAALDRRTHAEVRDAGAGHDAWIVRSDLDDVARRLRPDASGRLQLEDGRPARDEKATSIAAVLVEHLLREGPLPPLEIRLASRSLRADDGVTKLGLGSSASIAVALHAALTAHLVRKGLRTPDPDPLRTVLDSHRDLQGGRGSGADVAAATRGGLIRFDRSDDGAVRTTHLVSPSSLHWALVWTGRAASTTSFLKALEAARAAPGRAAVEVALERLHDLASAIAAAFEHGSVSRLLEGLGAYGEGLDALGRSMDCPVVSPDHRRMAFLATGQGGVYKPSGAGGGDLGVIFAESTRTLKRAIDAVVAGGYALLPAKVDPEGVTVSEEQ